MDTQRAYEWTAPGGDRLRLILDPAPRLQVADGEWWDDVQPTKYPRSLFAKLAEVMGTLADLPGDDATIGDQVLEQCFEITDIDTGVPDAELEGPEAQIE